MTSSSLRTALALGLVTCASVACKGKDGGGAPPAPVAAPTEVVPAAPAKPAAPAPSWGPAGTSADAATPVDKLHAGFAAPVTVTGYPLLSDGAAEADLGATLELGTAADTPSNKAGVRCELGEGNHVTHVKAGAPIVVTGQLVGRSFDTLRFEHCVIAAPDAAATPLTLDAIAAAYAGWIGKEIAVSGLGNGITQSTSTIDGKDVISDVRLDLDFTDADGRFVNAVGCHLPHQEPDPALAPLYKKLGPDFAVRGTITKVDDGKVQLEPCTVVSK